MITAKQYRVAAQHLRQAQESLRLARHFLGELSGDFVTDAPMHGIVEADNRLFRTERVCEYRGNEASGYTMPVAS